jgi:hypothetical protein
LVDQLSFGNGSEETKDRDRPGDDDGWLAPAIGLVKSTGEAVSAFWAYHPAGTTEAEGLRNDFHQRGVALQKLRLFGANVFVGSLLVLTDETGEVHSEPAAVTRGTSRSFRLPNALFRTTPDEHRDSVWQQVSDGDIIIFNSPGVPAEDDDSHAPALVNLLWGGDASLAVTGSSGLLASSGPFGWPLPDGKAGDLISKSRFQDPSIRLLYAPRNSSGEAKAQHLRYYADFGTLYASTHYGQQLPWQSRSRRPQQPQQSQPEAKGKTKQKKKAKVPSGQPPKQPPAEAKSRAKAKGKKGGKPPVAATPAPAASASLPQRTTRRRARNASQAANAHAAGPDTANPGVHQHPAHAHIADAHMHASAVADATRRMHGQSIAVDMLEQLIDRTKFALAALMQARSAL